MNVEFDLLPPGEFIRDELEARNWTQEDLATILGRPLRTVNQVIAGKKAVTPQTAKELAAAFGTSPELWLNLENAYRLGLDRREQGDVAKRARLFEIAPVKDMMKRGWICESSDTEKVEAEVKRFFGTSSLDESPAFACAARKATSYETQTPAQTAWCFRSRSLAKTMHLPLFNVKKANGALSELRQLAVDESLVSEVPALLASIGIRLVVVEHLPRSRIDGAAFWLDKKSPVIALSLRYDRIDWFWFTLMHELSHILNGDVGSIDVDLVGSRRRGSCEVSEIERRANDEASDFLVNKAELESFMIRCKPRFSKSKITQFAREQKIHPGLVVGQLQFRGEIPYSYYRDMLAPVRETLVATALTDGWGHCFTA